MIFKKMIDKTADTLLDTITKLILSVSYIKSILEIIDRQSFLYHVKEINLTMYIVKLTPLPFVSVIVFIYLFYPKVKEIKNANN